MVDAGALPKDGLLASESNFMEGIIVALDVGLFRYFRDFFIVSEAV
jgi:hypothetical protein